MGETRQNETSLIAVSIIAAAAIFLLDLSLPLGVAGGVPYVALVLLGWWSANPRNIVLFAVGSSILTLAGYHFSPEGGTPWVVMTNRAFAFFAIWVTALILSKAKRSELALRIAHEKLERQSEHALQKRVVELELAQQTLERQGAELVHFAEDLGLARDEAEAANRAKTEFLATMSHELRTPLNAIIGFSDIIKGETFGPVGSIKYREYAEDINESGQHLLEIINDILDLSKIEDGAEELDEEDNEIYGLSRAIFTLVEGRAGRGGIKLEMDLASDLPLLRADKRRLKQILVNLLANAIKFTHPGGLVTLRAWCQVDSGFVFQVTDTGIGIAAEDIPKALMRFGQVDGDLARQYEGTGLGLPLTKSLVELHGGYLDLQSQAEVGTTVTVRFPATRIVKSLGGSHSMDVDDREAG